MRPVRFYAFQVLQSASCAFYVAYFCPPPPTPVQVNYVNMQHNYVNMQPNSPCLPNYVTCQLIFLLHVDLKKQTPSRDTPKSPDIPKSLKQEVTVPLPNARVLGSSEGVTKGILYNFSYFKITV